MEAELSTLRAQLVSHAPIFLLSASPNLTTFYPDSQRTTPSEIILAFKRHAYPGPAKRVAAKVWLFA
jgi:hypothetical protein